MASKRNLRRKACEGKRRHLDRDAADHAARHVRWSRHVTVYPYKCAHCGGWHIGHPNQIAPKAEIAARRASGDKYFGPGHRDH